MREPPGPPSCPYCLTPADSFVDPPGARYFTCPSCRLIFREGLDAPDTVIQMRRYYENDYFRELAWDQLEGHRDSVFRAALDRIEKQVGRGRLLDVGCGCGMFLREALARGWEAKGIDPSRESIDCLNTLSGAVGVVGTLDSCDPGERYHVITTINVLDHLIDPWKDVNKAVALLHPGGLMYLRMPNGLFHVGVLRFMRALGLGNRTGRVVVLHNYAMVQAWLERMLVEQGLTGIAVCNAGISEFNGCRGHESRIQFMSLLRRAIWYGAQSIERLSAGMFLWGPSLEVMARKKEHVDGSSCAGSAER